MPPATPDAALPPALRITADDELKRQRLVSMKRVATSMLVAAAALFVMARVFEARYPWLSWVRAFAEAAALASLPPNLLPRHHNRQSVGLARPHDLAEVGDINPKNLSVQEE